LILSDYDPLVVINSKLRIISDILQLLLHLSNNWLNEIINQTEKEATIKKDRCEICNSKEDKNKLQGHHIGGRKHDHRQITVCMICHPELTQRQTLWDTRWLDENQSETLRLAFFYMGLYDILMLKAQRTEQPVYAQLASFLTPIISTLLKGETN